MKTEALFLFLILLLSLFLCSFLGGSCGNEGFTGNVSENRLIMVLLLPGPRGSSSTGGSSSTRFFFNKWFFYKFQH